MAHETLFWPEADRGELDAELGGAVVLTCAIFPESGLVGGSANWNAPRASDLAFLKRNFFRGALASCLIVRYFSCRFGNSPGQSV